MAQVSKLKEEIHQLESKKAELTLAKEKAENDVNEKIKNGKKVNKLTRKDEEFKTILDEQKKERKKLEDKQKEKETEINAILDARKKIEEAKKSTTTKRKL